MLQDSPRRRGSLKTKFARLIAAFAALILLVGVGLFYLLPEVSFRTPHLLFNRHTISPFRAIVEAGGKVVTWDRAKQIMTIENKGDSIKLLITTEGKQGIPIYVDGTYIGRSPLYKRLFPGKYEITAKPDDYIGSIQYLTLSEEYPKDKKITLPVDEHSYEDLLQDILRLGYEPIKVMDYYNKVPITEKTLILRHDVDRTAHEALKMAKLEHSLGIIGTYYFRWNTVDEDVIRQIKEMGHEVGLHYETLAFYAKEMGLKSPEEITPSVQEELRRRFKHEVARFEELFGDIYTVASHGAPENSLLGVTNYQAVMEGEDPLNYGLIGTAYGPITQQFNYLSDVAGIWRPFPYNRLENNEGPFYLLIHPVHWTKNLEG